MPALTQQAEPAELGLDPGALDRMERHFRRYVDDGRLPGWLLTVSRHGRMARVACCGYRDAEAQLPVEPDTLWRLYSMTKPVTSVAAMILYEEGAVGLSDPVSAFIPAFADVRVFAAGSDVRPVLVPATEPVRLWHLLTHTAGLTYGFARQHPVDALYRAAGFEWGSPRGMDLAACCDAWAGLPLLFQPGAEWNYSVATDVVGRVIEIAAGTRLDEFLADRVLGPLGMAETAYWVSEENRARLAALYTAGPRGRATRLDALGKVPGHRPTLTAGGSGLIGTAADYHRFTAMLLDGPAGRPGELDGVRLLGPRTVAYMGRNHLPGGADLDTFGRPIYADAPMRGVGFGLGMAVTIDAASARVLGSEGELSWGGAASTFFFADPATGLAVSFFTQLLPSGSHPIRPQLRQLAYAALTD